MKFPSSTSVSSLMGFFNERWQRGMKRSAGQSRQNRTRTRLSLESLEERTLLSNFTASNVTQLIGDIAAANSAGGSNTITLTGNTTFALSQVNNSTNGANGLPVISSGDNLTILGNGDTITRNGNTAFRLLSVAGGASLTLETLTLSGGLATGSMANGGAIFNQGNLTLQGVTVKGNTAQGSNGAKGSAGTNAAGGGIFTSRGSLSLQGGTILENNKALGGNGGNASGANTGGTGGNGEGGGLFIASGNVTLTGATVSGNVAQAGKGGHGGSGNMSHAGGKGGDGGLGAGGGLYIAGGSVVLIADTLSNNVAHGGDGATGGFSGALGQKGGNGGFAAGGGLYVTGGASPTLTRVLLTGNMADGGAGGTGGGGRHLTKNGFSTSAHSGGGGGVGGAASGGGLFTIGSSVTLTEDAVSNNAVHGGNGGNGGPGSIIGNGGGGGTAGTGAGGGLDFDEGTAMLNEDTIAGCIALGGNGGKGGAGGLEGGTPGSPGHGNDSFGGGIDLINASNATITDTTIVGNTSQLPGGGIDDSSTGTVALLDDTITGNSSTNGFGGGVFFTGTTGLILQNTIVASNSAATGGADVGFNNAGTGVDQGGNLIGISGPNSGNSGFTAATTQTGTVADPLKPLLGPLQYNGGPLVGSSSQQVGLQTEASLVGSPAIGKGVANNVATDERGFNRTVNGHTDIGAFEFQDAVLTVAVTPATPTVIVNGSDSFTITVTNTSGNALPADNSTLILTLSDGLTAAGPLTFSLAALPAGQSQSFTINTTATALGTQTLTATVASVDANTASNSARVTVSANTPPLAPPPITPTPVTPTPVGGLTLFGFGFGPTGLDLFEVDGQGDVFAQSFGIAGAGMSGAPQFVAADPVFTNLAIHKGAIVADIIGSNGQSFILEVLNFADPFVLRGLLAALFGGQ